MGEDSEGIGPKMTIVGGQPSKRHRFPGKIQVPVGVEKILYLAAGDDAFLEKLLDDRQAAILESGVTLRPSEKAMLQAIPREALSNMVAGIIPENPKRRKFMGLVAAAAASLAAGTAEISCDADGGISQTRGIGPDTESNSYDDTDIDAGADGG